MASINVKSVTISKDGDSYTIRGLSDSELQHLSNALTAHQTIKQDGITGATANRYGVCSTEANTAAKTVSVTAGTFSLESGSTIAVNFSNANTAESPTMNVDSTGAKNIYVNGSQITDGAELGLLTGIVFFIYDGTQYHLVGNSFNIGVVKDATWDDM